MRISRRSLIAGISSAVALAIVVTGVFLLTSHKPAPQRKAAQSPSASPSATVHKTAALTSPFTGERIRWLGRELIFKIDNVADARPPTGLKWADIVYLLPVDAGLSRIFAVFSSHFPPVVGPVRSAREEDIKLLRQFGRPAFAFSGAQPNLLPHVEHARIIDLYAGRVGGYFRSSARFAPHNLYADTRVLLREAKHASLARDIGFRFGPAPAGGKRATSYNVTYPAASFSFRWSPARHRWLAGMDGTAAYDTDGGRLGGATIVIQYVRVTTSVFRELGVRPPYVNAVGHGTAVVLRDGREYRVHWSRPRADGGTTFTLPDGARMPFAKGQVWVVFAYGRGSWR
ncbi:MAG TPA: DUF3048 domain-containing protein [Streptosporangiaceae bacterium]|nr:DUF3048 domain-containing protein [Streptosporangiaceae bacterium]